MWNPEDHLDEENIRWAFLRAHEWRHWPLFVSQPIVPVLLCFYPCVLVVLSLTLLTFAWWFSVASKFTPNTSIDGAVYFTKLKLIVSPVMAIDIWQNGYPIAAVLALAWPVLGNVMVLWLLMLPEAVLSSTPRAQAAKSGVIQKRLMGKLGYHCDDSGYIRSELGAGIPLSRPT